MVEREHIFPQESYKCFTSKAFLHAPPPNLSDIKKAGCYRWWVSCLLRCVCAQRWARAVSSPSIFLWSISLLHYSEVWLRHLHTLSRPDICSEPYSHSGKNTEPRGRFDSVHVWRLWGDLQMEDEIAAQKLCISGLRCTWFLHFKSPTLKPSGDAGSDFRSFYGLPSRKCTIAHLHSCCLYFEK